MNHSPFVGRRKAGADLPGDFRGFVGRKAADTANDRSKVFSVHIFHREKRDAVHIPDIEDAADVRMRNLTRYAHFGMKAGQRRRIL